MNAEAKSTNTCHPVKLWQHAKLDWNDSQPFSAEYQDIYFSTDNGLKETEYVFLQGNDLSTRWRQNGIKNFTIAETGFGTGLNFLCAAKLWLETAPRQSVLHFISIEKHPLAHQDITSALSLWPELTVLSVALLSEYDTLMDTGTAMLFDNRIKLSLLVGDASDQLSHSSFQADAWFLDGFSPAKNPDMWQMTLFEQMARLSHPHTTFATFTSAGTVRRGLTAAGFKVNKRRGFGKKREMIYGYFANTDHDN